MHTTLNKRSINADSTKLHLIDNESMLIQCYLPVGYLSLVHWLDTYMYAVLGLVKYVVLAIVNYSLMDASLPFTP